MFRVTQRQFRTLRSGDADFRFCPDGVTLVPRAGFEISQHCPREYRMIIAECISNGWLQPVAHMRESEHTWELLQQ